MALFDRLRTKFLDEGLTRNTTELYISKLRHLAKNPNPRSLPFITDLEAVQSEIGEKSVSTQVTYLASILAFLRVQSKVPKRLLAAYQKWMGELADQQHKKDANVKSEKQVENWMTWDQIISKREECEAEFSKIMDKFNGKRLSSLDFQRVQNYAVLCLYTMVPPRRNADYQEMVIVKSVPKEQERDMNYYGVEDSKFFFNNYKTSGHYGQQTLDVPEDLQEVLKQYASVIPGREMKFMICKPDGSKITYSNAITRILNRVFKKNVSSSMLRHIYLTSKYGERLSEQEADAEAMGHSVEEQRAYIKHRKEEDDTEDEIKDVPKGGSIKARLSNIREERLVLPDGMEEDD